MVNDDSSFLFKQGRGRVMKILRRLHCVVIILIGILSLLGSIFIFKEWVLREGEFLRIPAFPTIFFPFFSLVAIGALLFNLYLVRMLRQVQKVFWFLYLIFGLSVFCIATVKLFYKIRPLLELRRCDGCYPVWEYWIWHILPEYFILQCIMMYGIVVIADAFILNIEQQIY